MPNDKDLAERVAKLEERVGSLEAELAKRPARVERGPSASMGTKARCPFCRRRMHPEGGAYPDHTDKVEGGKTCPGAGLALTAPCSTCQVAAISHDVPGAGCKAFKRLGDAQ